ncbi:hypothetical protein [Streptomyces sp. CA-106131]|uniref:hypothetical protein n=1 Tax=Streptomyces sp. CA-106131 TaxID=3240045 RepID=UPI003D921E23
MDSERWVAVVGAGAGLVGAAVGGACAILSARVTALRGAQAAKEQWHRQSRRDAYAKLILVAQDILEDIFRVRRTALHGELTREHASETYTHLTERMTEVRAAKIAVEIAGPEGLDRFTGPVLINLLRAVEGLHPEALVLDDGRLSPSERFEGGFAQAGFAISDLTWCAREILNTEDITDASNLRPPFHDYTR